ncbi:hypothetical protein AK812_SmicGene15851 [Symbiodinium microadriaticum]|uniref:Uncharacterized protein n=1 Tax=Symbiodinium microadriaticum TaxID=2951 RepID=A0A1Q9E1U4_SYMMI|nr:hypothetical protein AK812_SmicGene15851 [Symbiodinium microadriaticum]
MVESDEPIERESELWLYRALANTGPPLREKELKDQVEGWMSRTRGLLLETRLRAPTADIYEVGISNTLVIEAATPVMVAAQALPGMISLLSGFGRGEEEEEEEEVGPERGMLDA